MDEDRNEISQMGGIMFIFYSFTVKFHILIFLPKVSITRKEQANREWKIS